MGAYLVATMVCDFISTVCMQEYLDSWAKTEEAKEASEMYSKEYGTTITPEDVTEYVMSSVIKRALIAFFLVILCCGSYVAGIYKFHLNTKKYEMISLVSPARNLNLQQNPPRMDYSISRSEVSDW